MNYEQQLQALKTAQQQATQIELQNKRDSALSDLEKEQSALTPMYQTNRAVLNTQNKIQAKNYNEQLINRGMGNSGIAPQAELSFNNLLQKNLGSLNQQEVADNADVEHRRTLAGNEYATGLASANQQIEANYITNLLAQQQQAWERDMAEKQYQESIRQFNENLKATKTKASSSSSGSGDSKGSDTLLKSNGFVGPIHLSSESAYKVYSEIEKFYNQNQTKGIYQSKLESLLTKNYENGSLSDVDVAKILQTFGLE